MPAPVPPWTSNTYPTAKSLNLAMYTSDGTADNATGLMFHARRPMLVEYIPAVQNLSTTVGGTYNFLTFPPFVGQGARPCYDSAGYYGATQDAGSHGAYQYTPAVAGSSGDGSTPGGWVVFSHFAPAAPLGSSQLVAQAGVGWSGTPWNAGSRQMASTGRTNTPFYLDLMPSDQGTLTPYYYGIASSSLTIQTNAALDNSGYSVRMGVFWGTSSVNQAAYGTPDYPAPQTSYTSATTLASAVFNGAGGPAGVLNFLSNPPALKIWQYIPNVTLASGTNQVVGFTVSPDLDSYGGWSNATNTYTVQRPGLYLVHGLVAVSNSAGRSSQAGFLINGVSCTGPAYQHPSDATHNAYCTKTQILSLRAGDTLQFFARTTTGAGTIANGAMSRVFLLWLCGNNGVPVTQWQPPDLSFRWASGTPGGQLAALFNTYLANDLNFLVNRPYFLGYQAIRQTGLPQNIATALTLDTVQGMTHADVGDSYGGWSPGPQNSYTAPVPGWYLVTGEFIGPLAPGGVTSMANAMIKCSSSGGVVPGGSDCYQQMPLTTVTLLGGGTVFGLYYLNAGETLTPQAQLLDYGSTWSTGVNGLQTSHMEIVWLSE